MWWCCGKPSKEAPGCKFSKHLSKEDEDDVEESQFKDDVDKAKAKKIKCQVIRFENDNRIDVQRSWT